MNGSAAYAEAHAALYGNPRGYIPANFRERIAERAQSYYHAHVKKLGHPNSDGWAPAQCLFHDDAHASASVNLNTGAFRCHGCGEHGDLVAVHMKLTGLEFKPAVRDLLGLPT